MSKCGFELKRSQECDAVATTTLIKNNGQVVQLCEEHRDYIINIAQKIADGELDVHFDEAETKVSHWLVKNKIPS